MVCHLYGSICCTVPQLNICTNDMNWWTPKFENSGWSVSTCCLLQLGHHVLMFQFGGIVDAWMQGWECAAHRHKFENWDSTFSWCDGCLHPRDAVGCKWILYALLLPRQLLAEPSWLQNTCNMNNSTCARTLIQTEQGHVIPIRLVALTLLLTSIFG